MDILIVTILGLCLGSFTNALVWRVHKRELFLEKAQKSTKKKTVKTKKLDTKYSILKGRSMCPGCEHALSWKDLVPVISWLSLGGKCRYCHKKVSIQYPFVEIIVALLFLLSYLVFPYDLHTTIGLLNLIGWFIVLVLLVALAVYDIKWMILPEQLTYPLILVSVVLLLPNLLQSSNSFLESTQSLVGSVLVASGIFFILHVISKGKWIGGGDITLGLSIGLLLYSPIKSFLVIFFASAMGTIGALPALIKGRLDKKSKLPFGPLLIAATIVVYLFGSTIIDWYLHSVLLLN